VRRPVHEIREQRALVLVDAEVDLGRADEDAEDPEAHQSEDDPVPERRPRG
jgi:hypothetical protein